MKINKIKFPLLILTSLTLISCAGELTVKRVITRNQALEEINYIKEQQRSNIEIPKVFHFTLSDEIKTQGISKLKSIVLDYDLANNYYKYNESGIKYDSAQQKWVPYLSVTYHVFLNTESKKGGYIYFPYKEEGDRFVKIRNTDTVADFQNYIYSYVKQTSFRFLLGYGFTDRHSNINILDDAKNYSETSDKLQEKYQTDKNHYSKYYFQTSIHGMLQYKEETVAKTEDYYGEKYENGEMKKTFDIQFMNSIVSSYSEVETLKYEKQSNIGESRRDAELTFKVERDSIDPA